MIPLRVQIEHVQVTNWTALMPTTIIGSIAIYIAIRQYQLGKSKRNLDFFDKRFVIYLAIVDMCCTIADKEDYKKFTTTFSEYKKQLYSAFYLLPPDLYLYLYEMRYKIDPYGESMKKVFDIMQYRGNVQNMSEPEKATYETEMHNQESYSQAFKNELITVQNRFVPVLTLRK